MSDDWKVEDYFVQFEDSYHEGPLVDAPLVHKAHRVGTYIADVLKACARCLIVDAEIPALITGLAAVDYLAGFHAGRESRSSDYKLFMERYFPAAYGPFLDRIYSDLRCGLVHNLVAVNPWRKTAGSFLLTTDVPNHLAIEGDRVAWSIRTFLVDTYRAWVMYAHHLIMAPNNEEAVERFHARFNRLAGVGAFMERVPDRPELLA